MTKLTYPSDSHLSGVALWRRIADAIRLDIVGGKRMPGEKLPGEMELAERFAANRHTVRRALAALQAEGVVRSEQGRGTFVDRARRISYRIGKRTRFSDNLKGQASSVTSELVGSRLENAAANVAAALGIKTGAKVTRLESVSTADGRPVSRATSWVAYGRFPDFARRFTDLRSITAVLASYDIADYARDSTRISARHADAEETAALKLAPGAILLVSEAIDTDMEGQPLLYAQSRFPADLLELVV